jgi:uncharacterized membrane protein YqjE
MNPSSDSGPSSAAENGHASLPPANWREALMALLASRAALIQLESKEVAREGARRAVFIASASACVIITWALLLVSGISIIAEAGGWPWSWVALAAAAVHLLLALIFFKLSKPRGDAPFPVTRAEFQKDREWIENFQNPKKSND